MLDSHPDIFCGPETNIAAHPGLWRPNADISFFLHLSAQPVACLNGVTWARPSSVGLSYHLVGLAEMREATKNFRNASEMLDYLFKPRLRKKPSQYLRYYSGSDISFRLESYSLRS
jgi:hypothetical protein